MKDWMPGEFLNYSRDIYESNQEEVDSKEYISDE